MSNMIHDIINSPDEYLPMLIILPALLLFWGGLSLSGFVSLLAATRQRRLWFALLPLAFGVIGFWAQIPISLESEEFRVSFDFRWFFIVPLLLGIAGVVSWRRARPETLA